MTTLPTPELFPAREQRVPQTSPLAAFQSHAAEINAAVARVLAGGWYLLGPETKAFEHEFADWVGVEQCITCASGTDALHLALRACGIGPGDEVITVSHTAVATVAAIELCGAQPVLVDIEPASFLLDPTQLAGALTERTRAVIAVHLYGRAADLAGIGAFCRAHGLRLIEDCSQAHGATADAGDGVRRVGSFGDLAAFSFYPTKNLGALGDGGAVVTRDTGLADSVRSLRQYGWRKERYVSEESGWNGRLDELQAAVLRVKLCTLDADNARRAALAAHYSKRLAGVRGLTLPAATPAGSNSVWHQYVIRCEQRAALAAHLHAAGIDTLVHYPVPIHCQPAYAGRSLARGPLPHSERAAQEVLSLPMFPELTLAAADRVADAVHEFFRK